MPLKIALLAATLVTPAADVFEGPAPDLTSEGIRIVALSRFAAERCGQRINPRILDATLARLNVDMGFGGSGAGRATADSFTTVYGGNPRRACDVAYNQLGPQGSVAPGVLGNR
ncbi:hypothetical protein [uncultured Methylobacterium sp.]|jgi:hypothetical protein|uniref:hypothetical protein n=1 Tax=uncultured Methylobacterium sp. TaxID=157278 RepID=UPI00262DDB19|nr:hypothetical protein [uncultured Methylobacterium sp.]